MCLPSDTLPYAGVRNDNIHHLQPDLRLAFYLENPVLEVLSKFSTSQNTANIYGSGAGSY